MANEMQRGNLTGTATMRMPISGTVSIGGKQMKELRFMPYSEFPETGREETLYIDTVGNAMYYWNGTEYIELSGGGSGGTSNYNELSNKPQINGNVLTGNKTASNLGLQEAISDIDTIRSGAASGSTAVQPATLATALATKQDVISDLASIRTGASKGDTAVQPADMEEALSGKQDTISDLQTIRSGAALGATAVQPSDMEAALADKQDVISDLDAIRSGATAGATALQPEDIDTLPTDGSSNPVSSGGTYNFVNSSIATNTAYFIGTFASVAELEAYSGTVTNNDYAFVTSTDSAGNTLYNRYKYNAATQTWSFEYAVNNTAFTTAQWASIQSGITSADKTKLDGIEQGANKTVIDASPTSGSDNAVSSGGVHTALSGKQDTIADLSDIRSGASAGATAVQPSALNGYQTKLSGTNKLDPSYIDYDASHRAVSDTEKTTWNGKQDTISDLSTIRSGAAAGATALQQSDVSSTYSASGTAPVNGTAVNAAIGTLDVSSVGGSGKYISEISETNGKISPTATTFDTALSSSSTNSNAPTSKTVYDDQQRQEVEIGAVANAGAKNLLNVTALSGVLNTATIDIADDGSIHISGRPTSNGAYVLSSGIDLVIPENAYILSMGAEAGDTKIALSLRRKGTTQYVDLYHAESRIIPSGTYDRAHIYLYSDTDYDTVVYPMIRPAAITDPTFVPYAKTNRELTVENASQQSEIDYAVNAGAKNLLEVTSQTQTIDGVTFTVNADQTITVNGTNNTQNAITYVIVSNDRAIEIPDGEYILSGCPQGGGTSTYDLRWYLYSSGKSAYDNGSGATVNKNGNTTSSNIAIIIRAGVTVSNIVFKPMLRPASITDSTFQPYALPNPTLTPAAIKAVDEGAKNLVNAPSGSDVRFINIPIVLQPGDYYVLFQNITSTDTDASTCQFGAFANDDSQASNYPQLKRGDNTGAMFTVRKQTSYVRLYAANDFAKGAGDTVTFTGCMLCTAADWAVSQKFVPYAPTNRELYEMIQALQNNS